MPVLVGKHPPQVGADHKARIGKAVFLGSDNLRRFQRIGPGTPVGAARDDKSHPFPEVAGAGFQAVDAESGAVGGQYIRNPRAVFDPARGHDTIADQMRLHQPVNEIPHGAGRRRSFGGRRGRSRRSDFILCCRGRSHPLAPGRRRPAAG